MLKLEIDNKPVEVAEGSMVMHAAERLGIYVPHFCYHPKLSIAANCRMCLVDVEKAPKPLPACATPVTNGMKVFTKSERAVRAQQGVMELLLINHPLDCPICDQGGECQLQDLAVGYGASSSHYEEPKRVVFHKSIGPLVSAEEMSRCIHCTRCVRFGQEIAGTMELGMVGRGEHAEITSFLGRSVDSELSGNMIDLCPVGALTSKPFRYAARTWELSRRRTVSGHDSLCSNMEVHVKQHTILRVVPYENPEVNECWLSDRDRFSYEGLNSEERLTVPMVKHQGEWSEVSWPEALDRAVDLMQSATAQHADPNAALGALGSGQSTVEELYLLGRLTRALGSDSVDFRLRQTDFSMDSARKGVPWLGMPLSDFPKLRNLLVIGSFLRKDHPLLSARIRDAVTGGAQLSVLHAVDDDWRMPRAHFLHYAPSQWLRVLESVCEASAQTESPSGDAAVAGAQDIFKSLSDGPSAILLGNAVVQHPAYAQILQQVQRLAERTGASFGIIGEAANSVGGYFAQAYPQKNGRHARAMAEAPCAAYLLLNVEPTLDHAAPALIRAVLKNAKTVALSAYLSQELMDVADCLLPIAPFTETAGTYVNTVGRVQTFGEVVPAKGQARPAWKVLRMLATQLGCQGMDYDTFSELTMAALPSTPVLLAQKLNNGLEREVLASPPELRSNGGIALERLPEVPIYASDPIVRRAISLQRTVDGRAQPCVRVHAETLRACGWPPGTMVELSQASGGDPVKLEVRQDNTVVPGVARIAGAHPLVARFASMTESVCVRQVK